MTRYVALLRGINVGGNQPIPMAGLRELLAGLGYSGVTTILQSGNAVFDAGSATPTAVNKAIEQALLDTYDAPIRVLVRTTEQIAATLSANPLDDVATNPSRYIVTFLDAEPEPDVFAAIDLSTFRPEQVTALGREVYAWYPGGQADSALLKEVTKALRGSIATARNWNTVTKIHARLAA